MSEFTEKRAAINMAKSGRPYQGMDWWRTTVRLSQDHSKIIGKYCRDHEKPQDSAAIRAAIDLMGKSMELSDLIETSCVNLLDIAKLFEKIDGANAPVYVEALKEAAALLWLFCYNGQMKEPLDIKINDSVL